MAEMDFMLCKLQIPNVCSIHTLCFFSISALSSSKAPGRCVSFTSMYFLCHAVSLLMAYTYIKFNFDFVIQNRLAFPKVDIFPGRVREINSIWKLLLFKVCLWGMFLGLPLLCFPTERKKTNLLFFHL